MKHYVRFIIISVFAIASLAVFAVVFAESTSSDYGLSETAKAAKLPTKKEIPAIIGDVIGAGLSLISVLFFALMLYAGIKWMIARGNEEDAKKALDTMIAAVIGLIIIMASYALTQFVFKGVKGDGTGGGQPAKITKFWCVDNTKNCVEITTKSSCIAGVPPFSEAETCLKYVNTVYEVPE